MIDQRTTQWFQQRLGKATASRICDIVAKTKSGYSTSRKNYAAQLVCERLTGAAQDSFTNAAMQWGTETEPLARDAYRQHSLSEVAECGFFDHPNVAMAGASPDGLVGDDGLLELKCPNSATHIDTLLTGSGARQIPEADAVSDGLYGPRSGATSPATTTGCPSTMRLYVKFAFPRRRRDCRH
jgi:putative phage-type endonuclease